MRWYMERGLRVALALLEDSIIDSRNICDDIRSVALEKSCLLRRNASCKVGTNAMIRADKDLGDYEAKKSFEGKTAIMMR
jgi:hypothetical protein